MLCRSGVVIKTRLREAANNLAHKKRARDFAFGHPGFEAAQGAVAEAEEDHRESLLAWWKHLKSCRDCRSDVA